MADMSLGSYTFNFRPDKFTIPKKEKFTAFVQTYTSAVFFSFGTSYVGKEIVLEWEWMPVSEFDRLNELYLADEVKVWTPGDGGTYNVQILNFTGEYFEVTDVEFAYREKVKMALLILECTHDPVTTTTTTTMSTVP